MGQRTQIIQDACCLHKERMKKPRVGWQPNSRLDYFATAANILGYPNAPLAWGLSNVKWNSKDELVRVANALAVPPNVKRGETQ